MHTREVICQQNKILLSPANFFRQTTGNLRITQLSKEHNPCQYVKCIFLEVKLYLLIF